MRVPNPTPAPQPRVLVLGRDIPITSVKTSRDYSSERRRAARYQVLFLLKGPWINLLGLIPSAPVLGQQLEGTKDMGEKLDCLASRWELDELEVLVEAIVPWLSPPTTSTGWHHI